jgi:hypothetical protein
MRRSVATGKAVPVRLLDTEKKVRREARLSGESLSAFIRTAAGDRAESLAAERLRIQREGSPEVARDRAA